MALIRHKILVTPAGVTGVASGNTTVLLERYGDLHALYLDFASTVTNDTVVLIKTTDPEIPIFTLTGSKTDAWYFPRETVNTATGASYTSTSTTLISYPIVGSLKVTASASSPVTDAVTAYVYIEER